MEKLLSSGIQRNKKRTQLVYCVQYSKIDSLVYHMLLFQKVLIYLERELSVSISIHLNSICSGRGTAIKQVQTIVLWFAFHLKNVLHAPLNGCQLEKYSFVCVLLQLHHLPAGANGMFKSIWEVVIMTLSTFKSLWCEQDATLTSFYQYFFF